MACSGDLRQSKRYPLKASVKFSWKRADGDTIRGEGFTRDIGPFGVFVLTVNHVPSGTVLQLEVSLPSLRAQLRSGACLRTLGHVVRSEEQGFAVAADLGFRMQFPKDETVESSFKHAGDNGGTPEAHELDPVSRFSM